MSKKIVQLCSLLISLSFCCTFALAFPNGEGIQTYQKNLHLNPLHKQKLAEDITRYRHADNLWDVLGEAFVLTHYENHPAVQEKIEWYMNNQDFLLRSVSRAAPYLYYILQQVKKRHLPAELVLLPIVESGYNPFAVSNVGATGIWQLMPNTASGLGVKQDWWYDARRDVIASTRGALNYLAYLRSFFDGNWLLAIAAYNTGEGNVLAAIKRNIRDGRDTDFWSLPVAQQTRDYVPSLLALAVIISHPAQYPIYFPPIRNAPYLAEVDVGNSQLSLKLAAALAGISYTKMLQLNPGFNRPSTATNKTRSKLVLPIENVEKFSENLAMSPLSQPITWSHYKVKSGDTLFSIAKKFHTTPAAVRRLNHLSKNNVYRGLNLLIPHKNAIPAEVAAETPVVTQVAEKKTRTLYSRIKSVRAQTTQTISLSSKNNSYRLQPGDTIYMVRSKDTPHTIAKHFHISPLALLAANQNMRAKFKPGAQIIVPTHLTKTVTRRPGVKPGDTIYMVRKGDTIEKIARRFHTQPAAIRLVNLIDNTSLVEGEKLVIPTHLS